MLRVLPEVLTIMREYRRCVEQALAVLNLPMVRHGPEIRQGDEEDELVIVGIHPVKKLLMLILGYIASASSNFLPEFKEHNGGSNVVGKNTAWWTVLIHCHDSFPSPTRKCQ